MSHRLFIAVDLPEPVRRRLARLVAEAPRGVRPVRPEQIHLTLHFLGDVDDAALDALVTTLGSVASPPFRIDLAGLGVFPPRGRPTVLWAGVVESDPLRRLHGAVGHVLAARGFVVEGRPWVPHVTLARLGPGVPRGWVAGLLDRHRDLAEPGIPVAAIRLYESIRTPEGTRHEPLRDAPLDPAKGTPEPPSGVS